MKLFWNINKTDSEQTFPINLEHIPPIFLDLQLYVRIILGIRVRTQQ